MEEKLIFLKSMLEEEVDINDEVYQKDFEDLSYKVNWEVDGAIGYQIYEQNKYIYKLGELLEDPDLIVSFFDRDFIKQLLGRENIKSEMGRSEGNYFP